MFGNDSGPTKIYSYGARKAIQGHEIIDQQMFLGHRYRNDLCRLDLDRREQSDNVLRQHLPGLIEVEAQIAEAETELTEALKSIKARNARARRQTGGQADKATTGPIRNRLAELRRRRKELRGTHCVTPEEVKEQRSVVAKFKLRKGKAQGDEKIRLTAEYEGAVLHLGQLIVAWHARDPVARDLAAVGDAAERRRKELRHASHLFWPNYLQVEAATAKFGQGAPPRFRSWRGDGKVAVQLQGGLSVPEALACTDTQLRVEILERRHFSHPSSPANPNSNRQRNWKQAMVWLRIGTDGRQPIWAKIPMIMKRPLPEDAVIQWAYFIRRRHGVTDHWSFQFVLTRKAGWEKPEGPSHGQVGIDVGWRLKDNGDLRVAFWAGSDGATGELALSAWDVARWTESDRWQGIRDRAFDEMRNTLALWIQGRRGVLPEALAKDLEFLPKWRSPARLCSVIRKWKENRISGDEQILPVLEVWRKQDRHLYNYVGNVKAKAIRWRQHLYRMFALEMRRRYATAIIEDLDAAELMRKPAPEARETVIAKSRYMQRVAAPGNLLSALKMRMDVKEQPAEYTTRDCYACGHRNDWDTAMALVQTCGQCGRAWDQDENAALNLLHHEDGVEESVSGGD